MVVGKGKAVGAPVGLILESQGRAVEVLETHPEIDPDWAEQLKDSGADTVIGAARGPHCLNEQNLPSTVRHLIDVAYCEAPDGSIVGNFDLDSDFAKNLKTSIRPTEVGAATVKVLLGHVKAAATKTLNAV